jgi:F-type H+-transporting ATPase subunit b
MSDEAHGADAAHAAEAAAHGGESAGTFPPFDSTLFASQLAWFAITFAVLYLIVSRFILPSVSRVLEKRAGVIKADIDTAAAKSARADEAREAMEKASAKARADARAMVEAARAEVQASLAAEQANAEARLVERIGAAETRVSEARAKALAEAPTIAESLARDIAAKLLPANA